MGDTQVLRIIAPGNRAEERQYIFSVIFTEWLGIEYHLEFEDGPEVRVGLVGDPNGSLITFPDVLFATPEKDWLTARSLPRRPLTQVLDPIASSAVQAMRGSAAHPGEASLPVIYGVTDPSGQAWRATATGAHFSVDIFGSIFFLLTRYEEAILPDRDAHDRFPSSASLAAVEGLVDRPLADDYVEAMWTSMKQLWSTLERRPTPFRLRLTHDVDEPWAARRRRCSRRIPAVGRVNSWGISSLGGRECSVFSSGLPPQLNPLRGRGDSPGTSSQALS